MDSRGRGPTSTGSSPPASLLEHYHYDRLRNSAGDDDEDDGCCADNSAALGDDDELDLMTVVRGGGGGGQSEKQPLLSVVKSTSGSLCGPKPYGAHLDYTYLSRKGLIRGGGASRKEGSASLSGSIYPSLGDSGFADSGTAVVVVPSGAGGAGSAGGAVRRFQVSISLKHFLRPLSFNLVFCFIFF